MNQTSFALLLPHIDDDFSWVTVVLGVNKTMSACLDIDHHWEEHFQIKCADLKSPHASFVLMRHVPCKFLIPSVYIPSIAKDYAITISLRSKFKCFARQAFRQFLMARAQLDEYFPEDDVPSALFVCKPLSEQVLECKKPHCLGEIPVRLVVDITAPLIQGDLQDLLQLLEEEIEPQSDDSFDCSECGESHSSGWM
jgi:hypothetical protein